MLMVSGLLAGGPPSVNGPLPDIGWSCDDAAPRSVAGAGCMLVGRLLGVMWPLETGWLPTT